MEKNDKPKIAVVIQRYGQSVLGGESLCRSVMKHLQASFNITILTTCAQDYRIWGNEFDSGWQKEENITILRFPVRKQRSLFRFKWFSRWTFLWQWLYQKGYHLYFPVLSQQKRWLQKQGPYCPELIEFLKQNYHRYDAFFFFTYLYYPTALGIEQVSDKAILVPCAHDERPIYLNWFRRVFNAPIGFIFLTPEERDFVNKVFKTHHKLQYVAGMKIPSLSDLTLENYDHVQHLANEFLQKYHITKPYILYTGRIDIAKGAKWMFQFFTRFIRETKHPVELVLLGKAYVKIPKHPQIRYLGYLSEQEKYSAILKCEFFLMPSYYESFSVSLLEAFGLCRPAIVNGKCAVLKGHIERSHAGFAAEDYVQFKKACLTLLTKNNSHYGTYGLNYIQQHYSWEKIEETYHELVDAVKNKHRPLDEDRKEFSSTLQT